MSHMHVFGINRIQIGIIKMASILRTLIVFAACLAHVSSHAALYIPSPRNSNDRYLPNFRGGRSPRTPCTCDNGLGNGTIGCEQGLRSQGDGQACLWWSQGCSIGCKTCATAAGGTTPIRGSTPHTDKIGFRTRYCNDSLPERRLPAYARTMNLGAAIGSEEDSYQYNPWRAPGSAPVIDACGQAGGKYPQTPIGGDSVYTTTPLSTMGDLGTKVLKYNSSNVAVWKAGTAVEVAWGMRYNHGGGYQYRLCSLNDSLTEKCFQRTILEFDRTKQALVWNNGTRFSIQGMFVDIGTYPEGSTWARNPIPRVNTDNIGLYNPEMCPGPDSRSGQGKGSSKGLYNGCMQFPPPCPQDTEREPWSTDGSGQGACSGDWTAGLISDHVLIPDTLAPGNYVLSWRYDCEETAQVWLNCADVKIVT